ncbi:MAG TPA: response regulator transcription factor [Candidatus Dormibacteraeota bacterium]|nr:response regulator transcription factor [Candidatus Dormibacteraeota bacterium]
MDIHTSQIKLLIVEDHKILAAALQTAFAEDGGITVTGCAGTMADALEMGTTGHHDVVLMNFHLPDGNGAEATGKLLANRPDTRVVILATEASESVLTASVDSGALGFVLKSQPFDDLLKATIAVANGGEILPTPRFGELVA